MSTQLPYRPQTLRLQALRPLDETAVRLFLKLAQQRLRQAWIVVDERAPIEADVVLLPPGVHPQRGRRVVWVLAPGQEAPQDGHPVLTRPLQLEAFYEVLQVLGAARPAAPILAEPAPSQTLTRYRLQRWPSSQLLSQHPQGARLASFLSARYLSATELARLSHAPSEACARFIHAMRHNKLVEVQTPSPDTVMPDEPTPARKAPAWIGLLRHKLQLTDTLQPIG